MDLELKKVKQVLKIQLKKKKFTYEMLATELAVSVPTVKRWLGDGELSLSDLHRITKLLGFSLSELHLMAEKVELYESSEFTEEQKKFLAKHPSYMTYFMRISAGLTPAQIQEKYGISKLSNDKYLLKLEQLELIKVSGTNNVSINFPNFPNLGDGPLSEMYYKQFMSQSNAAMIQVFEQHLYRDKYPELDSKNKKKDLSYRKYSSTVLKMRRDTFETFRKESFKLMTELEKTSELEERISEPEDLVSLFLIDAHCIVDPNDKVLDQIADIFGPVKNI